LRLSRFESVRALARAAGLVSLAIATCSQAQSQYEEWWQYNKRSVAMLPPYCKYTPIYGAQIPGLNRAEVQAEVRAETQRWSATMGEQNWRHMHHYCKGLEAINYALYSARTKLAPYSGPDRLVRRPRSRRRDGLRLALSARDYRWPEPGAGHAQLYRWLGFSGAARRRTRRDDSG